MQYRNGVESSCFSDLKMRLMFLTHTVSVTYHHLNVSFLVPLYNTEGNLFGNFTQGRLVYHLPPSSLPSNCLLLPPVTLAYSKVEDVSNRNNALPHELSTVSTLPLGGQVMAKKSQDLFAPCSCTVCTISVGCLSLANLTCSRQYGTRTFWPGLNLSTCSFVIW